MSHDGLLFSLWAGRSSPSVFQTALLYALSYVLLHKVKQEAVWVLGRGPPVGLSVLMVTWLEFWVCFLRRPVKAGGTSPLWSSYTIPVL